MLARHYSLTDEELDFIINYRMGDDHGTGHMEKLQFESTSLTYRGDPDLLQRHKLGIFCSVKCTGEIILKSHDFAESIKDKHFAVISGFHSPVEKEILTTLLNGTIPIIICPARSLENMRVPAAWKPEIDKGRLLLISPFKSYVKRSTEETVNTRNELVAELSQEILVAHASPGGKTEAFSRDLLSRGKMVYTIPGQSNENLINLGARIMGI